MPLPTGPALILNLPWGTLGVFYSVKETSRRDKVLLGYPGRLRNMEATMPREAARFFNPITSYTKNFVNLGHYRVVPTLRLQDSRLSSLFFQIVQNV